MRLQSALDLKQQLLTDVVAPFAARANRLKSAGARAIAASAAITDPRGEPVGFGLGARPPDTLPSLHRSVALGVAPASSGYRLAIRIQRTALLNSRLVELCRGAAKGEADIRLIGRVDKRARARRPVAPAIAADRAASPWYQGNTRPLLIGASIGHVDVTAGTIGAFVRRGASVHVLSNNHVLANENAAETGDWVLQRAKFDGGRHPADAVARLRAFVRLKARGANFVDAAVAALERGIGHDAVLLRGLVNGRDRQLAGLAPSAPAGGMAPADAVFKIGRTTGATRGRVSAFAVDNLVVNYDSGNLRFDDQIEIEAAESKPFSDGGDSGSLIVTGAMQAYALLFAGSDMGGRNNLGLTFANPIHRVLTALKASLAD
jgi:hypothetical protein